MGNKLKVIPVIVISIFVAFYVIVEVTSSRSGNGWANLAKVMTIGAFIWGLVRPQSALISIVFLSVFQNMVKRFAVYEGSLYGSDMIYTNAPPAMVLAGATLGTLAIRVIRRDLFEPRFVIAFSSASVLFLGILARSYLKGEGMSGLLNAAANAGAYVYMIPLAVTFVPDSQRAARLMKTAALLYVPVAIYAFSQSIFGLNDVDAYYYDSAFTIVKIDAATAGWFGMGGTLHNGVALSATMLVVIYFLIASNLFHANQTRRSPWNITVCLLLVIFMVAAVIGAGRAQWIGIVAGLLSLPFLTRAWAAVAAYCAVILLYLVMVFSSDYLMERLESGDMIVYSGDSENAGKALQTWTLIDRLIGLHNMKTNGNLWKPFGAGTGRSLGEHREEDVLDHTYTEATLLRSDDYVHDMISQTIITIGYIPFLILLVIGGVILAKIVRAIRRARLVPGGGGFKFMVAGLVGILATGVLTDRTLVTFPSNMLTWLLVGLIWVSWVDLLKKRMEMFSEANKETVPV